MIRRELNGRHWYGTKMRGSRKHRQFILDGMICLGIDHSGRASHGPVSQSTSSVVLGLGLTAVECSPQRSH